MAGKANKDLNTDNDKVQMGAKIANQINSIQQSNILLAYSCATTQSCTSINVNFA